MKTARAWLLILALVLVGAAATGAQGTQYEVIRIPIPTYANLSSLGTIHLNDVGQVVGYVVTNEAGGKQINHAFLWDNRGTRDLGFPAEALSAVASSINNQGQVVGYAYYQDATDPNNIINFARAQVWQQGSWRDLGTLGGKNSFGYGIQRDGTLAVGDANINIPLPNVETHACVWDIAGTAKIDLGTLGGIVSQAYGISNTGEVMGYNTGADNKKIPYLWVPNTTINFALPLPAGATEALASHINRNKVAVGSFIGGTPQAFVWVVDLNGKTAELVYVTMPASSLKSGLVGINDHCQAVGNFQDSAGKNHAILARVPRAGPLKVVDLNDLLPSGSGWELGSAVDINNRGEIVGIGKFNGTQAFFLLRPWGLTMERRYKEVVALPDLGGGDTSPWGLNNSGRVVGSSYTATREKHAFLWAQGYKMADLGVPKGYTASVARSINANGVVAAIADTAPVKLRAFLWGADFGWEDLGTLGGADSYAFKINNYNQVAGAADDAEGNLQPCNWYTGIPFKLNTLGGREGFAYAINRGQTIVGWSRDKTNAVIGCYWLKDVPQPQALPNLPGCVASLVDDVNNTPMPNTLAVGHSMNDAGGMRPALWNLGAQTVISLGNLGLSTFEGHALAINDRAQVVGWSSIATDTSHAFLVDPGLNHGAMTDLNQLIPPDSGWELYEATAINNRGEIVGTGCNGCEGDAAFFLPVKGVAESAIDLLLSD